jgi:hypothetical protein
MSIKTYLYRECFAAMKLFTPIFILLGLAALYLSCQRELFFDNISIGSLKKDSAGNCQPAVIGGLFTMDTVLDNKNFIDVHVDVSFGGSYDISSDTVNGYFFHASGNIKKGDSIIRLFAKGSPKRAGTDNFIFSYGTSTCIHSIKVESPKAAAFELVGAPNSCTGFFADGTYAKGKALTASNILTIKVNVTVPGSYTITANTNNGFSFSASDIFTATGVQDVILKGKGIPVRDEVSTVTVSNLVSSCNFGITVVSDSAGKAIFSFDGTPNDCINYAVNGNYYAGIAAVINNNIMMHINVTKAGTYDINTNTANGIVFTAAGSFSVTGPQIVTLVAKGIPMRQELTSFIPNTGTQSCNFVVNVQALPPPAVFSLSGAPTDCAPVTVNGFYIVSKPLDNANTVVIQANVTTPGSYTVTTNTVNGINFSASGVFSNTGLQNMVLRGSGIPQATGTSTLKPSYGASACSFSITVQ